jgi:DNA-binding CsgD family transcriptional regulator
MDWWIDALAAEFDRLRREVATGSPTTQTATRERLAALRWHTDNAEVQMGPAAPARLRMLDAALTAFEASLAPQSAGCRHGLDALTARQREVLRLIAEGRSMKQAAAELRVSPRTVAFHKYRMMRLLRVRTSVELLRFAMRTGLVTH